MSESRLEGSEPKIGDGVASNKSESELTQMQQTVLEYICSSCRGVTTPEIADDLDMPRSTVLDQVNVLVEKGLVNTEKPSSAVRLYFTDLQPQWGDYEILNDAEREYLRTGDTGGVPEFAVLKDIILALEDFPQEIPFDEAPVREEIELIAKRGGISEPIESVSFMCLRGGIMRVLPEDNDLEQLYAPWGIDSSQDMKRARSCLDVSQSEMAEALAEFNDVTKSTYQARISKWENGETDLFSSDEISCMEDYLKTVHIREEGGFSISPDWL